MLDYLWDLESDFSAIHGIRDMYSMPSPRFFAFVYRISSYRGVMRTLLEIEEERKQDGKGGTPMGSSERPREVSSETVADIATSELAEFIEVAEG